ncbi:MAG: efflux RND transporter periplasmic adaptor subunit [Puniceicoccaceae bacterium]
MKKFLITIASIAGIIVLTGMAFAGLMATKTEPEKREIEVQRTLVEIVRAKPQPVYFHVQSQGTVSPRTETTLFPEVSGLITHVAPSLYAGGTFEKGEVLLQIDSADYEAAVISAEAQLARAEVDYLREKALSEQALKDWVALGKTAEEAPSLALREPQLKEAQANIRSAEAALARARRNLQRTTIVAPYEGMVRERYADLGQVVNPGTQLAQIFATDFVEIRLPLTAEDLLFIDLPFAFRSVEDTAPAPKVILVSRFGGMQHQWVGHIVRTEGTIDPKSRVMYAVARVEDPYGRYNPSQSVPLSIGMFVQASLQGRVYDPLVVIPRHALRGSDQVLVVNAEDSIHRRNVGVLRTDDKWAYLQSGIQPGERICLTALEFVVEGMPVEAVENTDVNLSYYSNHHDQFSLK